ncbi:hypothetical protein AB0H00_13730 [Nocardia sp. NPDC023852]|uniref:hypothetical protein n=1 Tax=Nocardia sp. NPDC023852 TaxID=3154697 RepID=UPI003408A4FD
MSAEPILTPEQAKQYLIEAFGTSREYRMYPFELGWAIHPILSSRRLTNRQKPLRCKPQIGYVALRVHGHAQLATAGTGANGDLCQPASQSLVLALPFRDEQALVLIPLVQIVHDSTPQAFNRRRQNMGCGPAVIPGSKQPDNRMIRRQRNRLADTERASVASMAGRRTPRPPGGN